MTKPKNPTLVPDLDLSKEAAAGDNTERGIGIPLIATTLPGDLPDKLPPLPAEPRTALLTEQAQNERLENEFLQDREPEERPAAQRPAQLTQHPAARPVVDAEPELRAPRRVERETTQRTGPDMSAFAWVALALLVAGAMVAGAIIWGHNQKAGAEVAKKVTTTSATTTVTTTTEPAPVPAPLPPVINVTAPSQMVYVPAPVPTPPTPVTPRRRSGSRNAPGAAVANVDDNDEKKREAHVASEIARVQVEARTSERTRFEAASQPTVTP